MVIKNVPAPRGNTNANTRALIFDSNYDEYRGVVAYIRVIDGCINKKDKQFYIPQSLRDSVLNFQGGAHLYNPSMNSGQFANWRIEINTPIQLHFYKDCF